MEHKDTKAQSIIPIEEYRRLNQLSNTIIGAAIEVHREFGPGLLESVYEECLKIELESQGLNVQSQVDLPLIYKGMFYPLLEHHSLIFKGNLQYLQIYHIHFQHLYVQR